LTLQKSLCLCKEFSMTVERPEIPNSAKRSWGTIRSAFTFGLWSMLLYGIAFFLTPLLLAQTALNQRVLVVYNSADSGSTAVANYYIAQRNIPAANLCPITPPSTTTLTWSQYVSTVKTPVQNCLRAVGPDNILYVVFTYQTPFTVKGASNLLGFYSLDSYVADIWDQYATQDAYPYPAQLQPYYEDAQSQGNLYQNFVPFSTYRAQTGALQIYSVWRLDAATSALAMGLVDKALAAEAGGLNGQACLDRLWGNIAKLLDSDRAEGEWDLHKAAVFAGQAGFSVTEDSNPAEFGTPPAPNCPNAALYSGWYHLGHYNDAFTWNTGAIGWHLDSGSAQNPRGGPNWSANAIIHGITVTSGSVNEPYLQGLVRPGGTFRDLLQGANVGDAFLRNTRWLKWMILNLGDPLYRPFPNGLSPFNPPPPQASLALSSRYVVNGDQPTGIVTLASAAPQGGQVVDLLSGKTSLVQVPASVTVPGGQRTATFPITTALTPPVTVDTAVAITASGVGQNALTVSPLLGGLFITTVGIMGGTTTPGLIILNGNAPSGGATVALSGNNPAISMPSTVTVPQGSSQATFTISSSAVPVTTTTTVTASLNGVSLHTNLILQPALKYLGVPATLPGGASASGNVILSGTAPQAWPVSLNSSNPAVASVPSTVSVPAGSNTVSFPITTTAQCSDNTVTIKATSGGNSLSRPLIVTPPPASFLGFNSSVKGGNAVTATVYIAYPACSAGQPVTITSSNPSVASVPASVTVPSGKKSATFTITTTTVTTSTAVTISATSDNVTKIRVLTVTP
jgi:uncharacterized protein (TIGR03790 family)